MRTRPERALYQSPGRSPSGVYEHVSRTILSGYVGFNRSELSEYI